MNTVRSIARFVFLIVMAALAIEAWAQAGTVRAASGKAYAQDAKGTRLALKVGQTFPAGTTFHTTEEDHLELVLADGQVLILGRMSAVRIDQFAFDSRNPNANLLAIVLLQGSLRFVGGVIANAQPEAVRITAGVSMIGILARGGVDFIVVLDSAVADAGVLSVSRGEVSLTTPFGVIGKITKDQVARWQPSTGPNAVPAASLPAIFQAQIMSLQSPEAVGQAGTVRSVTGTVVAQAPSGERQRLAVGDSFVEGTTFFTGNNESAELVLADGQLVLLGQKSVVRIDRFEFDRQFVNLPNASAFGVTVLNGLMRFVGGVIAINQPESVRITAGDTNIGILRRDGIDFTVGVGLGPQQQVSGLTVRTGEVTLTSPVGLVTSVTAGQGASWQPGLPPTASAVPLMPAAILADLAGIPPSTLAALAPPSPPPPPADPPAIPPPPPVVVSPGGGGGCVGSPC